MVRSNSLHVDIWRWACRLGLLLACVACLGAMAQATGAEVDRSELRYGLLADFPPYQIWPEGGEPGGADLDMLRRLAPALGLRVTPLRYTDRQALEADLQAGRIDIASSIGLAPERKALRYSASYATIDQAMVMRADDTSSTLAPDLAGRRLARVRGHASEGIARELFPLATPVEVDSVDEALRALIDERADVLVEAQPVVVDLIERRRLAGLRIARTLSLPGGNLHFAGPASQAATLDSLSAALAGMDEATRQTLLRRWSAEPLFARRDQAVRLSEAERDRLQAQAPLRIAVVGAHPPFAWVDGEGQARGFSVDLLRDMLARAGLQAGSWRAASASGALGLLARGEIDLAVGLQQSTSQSEAVQFVGPYLEHPLVLIGKPAGSSWGLDTLVGRRLALPAVHFARPLIAARYPGIEIVACDELAGCIERVGRGEADAAMADVVSAALTLSEMQGSAVQMTGAVSGLRQEHSYALSRRQAELRVPLQKALDASVMNALPELKQRWFTRPEPGALRKRVLLGVLPWAAGGLALLLAAWAWHSGALRAEVRRTRDAERQATRSRDASERFVTFLAHEVRNSLHSVIAGTELLRSAKQITPAVTASLGESARSTLSLLNNLLDRDRLEAGQLSLHLEPTRLDALLKSVAVEMLPAALAKQLALTTATGGADPLLRIDALRVQQVVRNLVANAIKYSSEGEIRIESRIAPLPGTSGTSGTPGTPARCEVEVRVTDQGPGIAAADLARLFERYRIGADASGQASASGLGLPLCRDLAVLMGGELLIDSTPGHGTTATLRWPAELEPARTRESAPQAPATPSARRFLVVEDGEVYAMLIERALALQGLSVSVAGSVARARELLARERYEVVVTDLHLGDGEAHEVIHAALAAAQTRADGAVPTLIVMSAEFTEQQQHALRGAGARAVLTKTGDVGLFAQRLLQHPALQPAEPQAA